MIIIEIIMLLWIVVAMHEVGHLGVAIALGQPVSSIHIGCGPPLWTFQHRGIHLRLFTVPISGVVILAFMSRKRWKNIAVLAGGPAVNIVTGLALLPLTSPPSFLRQLAAISLCVGFINLMPFHTGSDGSQILKLLGRIKPVTNKGASPHG